MQTTCSMRKWKTLIRRGNQYFFCQNFDQAMQCYEAARRQAEWLFDDWDEPEEAVSSFVVTHHNIADVYQKRGEVAAAREILESVHAFILKAVTSTPISDGRHPALYRASIITYSTLMVHKRCHLLSNLH